MTRLLISFVLAAVALTAPGFAAAAGGVPARDPSGNIPWLTLGGVAAEPGDARSAAWRRRAPAAGSRIHPTTTAR
jgi:hypothetical protein